MQISTIASNRHVKILDILSKEGKVRVDTLSDLFDVAPITIRRDLDYLDSQKLLIRTHGGATRIDAGPTIIPEENFSEKGISHTFEKQRIAQKAAELIEDDAILYVNSGSTVLYFIQALKDKHIRIITNNAGAIGIKKDPSIEMVMLGGEYREKSRSFIGIITIENIQKINSTHTVLGINGFSLERGLMTSVLQECTVNQAMIQNTNGNVIVLADHSKIGKVSNFATATLDKVDILVTDDQAPKEIIAELEKAGITVIIA